MIAKLRAPLRRSTDRLRARARVALIRRELTVLLVEEELHSFGSPPETLRRGLTKELSRYVRSIPEHTLTETMRRARERIEEQQGGSAA